MIKQVILGLAVLGLALAAGCNEKPADAEGSASAGTATATASGGTATAGGATAGTEAAAPQGWTGDAKDFSYIAFEGESGHASDFTGKPLVVNFWAVWWGSCVRELPAMQETYTAMNGKFEFLAIALDDTGDPQNFVKQQGFTFTAAFSPEATSEYSITSIPVTLFFDRNGVLVETVNGGMDKMEFENKLSKIL